LLDARRLFDRDRTDEASIWILRLAVYQKLLADSAPDYAIGQQSVELARERSGERVARFVNGVLRRLLPGLSAETALEESAALPPAIRYSMPDLIVDALASGYGRSAIEGVLRAFNAEETRVHLRVNTLKTDLERVAAEAAREGCELAPSSLAPGLLRWTSGSLPPWRASIWKRGWIAVQDPAALVGVAMLDPRPGESVLDWCAAPGGKTGHIWELMGGRGELFALEVNARRRRSLNAALARLYGAGPAPRVVESPEATPRAKRILVDAPCLGLGLLGRHPEGRWDRRMETYARVLDRQRAILEAAADRLAPGGRLVWVTCSPTRAENEDLLERRLAERPDFLPLPASSLLPAWAKPWTSASGWVARTRPDRAPVDGFAMAAFKRR
jgi:16S rRNA (cytosine967-C5)-methyltransferase